MMQPADLNRAPAPEATERAPRPNVSAVSIRDGLGSAPTQGLPQVHWRAGRCSLRSRPPPSLGQRRIESDACAHMHARARTHARTALVIDRRAQEDLRGAVVPCLRVRVAVLLRSHRRLGEVANLEGADLGGVGMSGGPSGSRHRAISSGCEPQRRTGRGRTFSSKDRLMKSVHGFKSR